MILVMVILVVVSVAAYFKTDRTVGFDTALRAAVMFFRRDHDADLSAFVMMVILVGHRDSHASQEQNPQQNLE
jgi:hypothetical protein